MKKMFLLIFLSFIGSALALSASVDKNTVEKGETVIFSGECKEKQSIAVKATKQTLEIFEAEFGCPPLGNWEIPQEISFLMPSGEWKIVFSQENETKTVILKVLPSRESSLLVIDFFNEPPSKSNRLDLIILDLKLLENNNPVENAILIFWDFNGEQKKMQEVGQGIYRGFLQLPASATLGDFDLFLVAEKFDEGQRKGTEYTTKITVNPAPLLLSIENPTRFSFEIGKPVNFEIKTSYLDNSPLEEPKVFLTIGETMTELKQKTPVLFEAAVVPVEQHATTKKILVTSQDKFGNKAEIEKAAVFSRGIFLDIYSLFFWLIVVVILATGFSKVVLPKIQQTATRIRRPSSEKEIREKIKKLQTDYYKEQKITRKEYQEKMAVLQKELDELKNA